jgi:type IV pilus assembly protein PilM
VFSRLNPFRKARVVGLDVGAHSLKWVVLEASQRVVLEAGQKVLFPDDSGPPDPKRWEQRVQECLQPLPKANEVEVLNAVVQGRSTASGYLEFPSLQEDELKVAAQAEAQRLIPFPPDQIQFSYTRVPSLNGQAGSAVFFAAALLSEVARLRSLLAVGGRTPTRVEIPALALAREFSFNHGPSHSRFHVLLNIGYQLSHLVVVRDGYPYFARDFSPGAADFIEALRMDRGCSWAEAESLLGRADLESHSSEAPLFRLVEAITRSLQAFLAESREAPAGLFLSGGGNVSNLAEALGRRLEYPVAQETWQNLKCQAQPAGLFKLAAGLAIT